MFSLLTKNFFVNLIQESGAKGQVRTLRRTSLHFICSTLKCHNHKYTSQNYTFDFNDIFLLISFRNLVQRDRFARSVEPLCILYFKSRGTHQWKEVGRTERLLNTLSPEWSQTMVLDYYFEEKQVSTSL